VGNKKFQPDDAIFDALQSVGQEYGATTGRPRQCNCLNWDTLEKAININGVTDLIFNKTDILRQINKWKLTYQNKEVDLKTEEGMKAWICNKLSKLPNKSLKNSIIFSGSPCGI
jgi:adenylosuccinate synthase